MLTGGHVFSIETETYIFEAQLHFQIGSEEADWQRS